MLRIPIVLSVLLALPLSRALAQQADTLSSTRATPVAVTAPTPLTLAEVYALARERNPMLQASAASVEAVRAREASAKLPPDPQLQLGVMNTPFPGVERMSSSLQPSVQLMQMVPIAGQLGLSGKIARQSTAIERAQADETDWMVRGQAATHFYEIYRIDRQLDVMRETLEWLKSFEQVARAMYASGQGRQSDVLRASVEVARMDADTLRMRAMRTAAVARLNAVLDQPAATAVPAVAWTPLPLDLPAADTLGTRAESAALGEREVGGRAGRHAPYARQTRALARPLARRPAQPTTGRDGRERAHERSDARLLIARLRGPATAANAQGGRGNGADGRRRAHPEPRRGARLDQ